MDHSYLDKLEEFIKNRKPMPEGDYVHSAVMVLLSNINGELSIFFCKRALTIARQPGDICFPGGRLEENETPLDAALRETYEEIGLLPDEIKVLGKTDFVVMPWSSIVNPYLGYVENVNIKNIHFNPDEVDSVFTVPLSYFFQTQPAMSYIYFNPELPEDFPIDLIYGGKDYKWSKPILSEPFYKYEDKVIWGLTARITKNICNLIKGIEI